PFTLVGSKNLTDAAGAVVYDEVIAAKGPIAAIVQDDFYYDMAYALRYEMDPSLLEHIAKNGWAKSAYQQGQSASLMAANELAPCDVLRRYETIRVAAPKWIEVDDPGNTPVRSGYDNVDSTRSNAIDQKFQAIRFGKQNI